MDFPPNPPEKPGYLLEFHDEFNGPEIDTANWLPYYLPQWSSRQRSAPKYVFEDGCLILQITENQPPWCPEFDGGVRCSSIQTGVFSGPVGSRLGQHRFSDALVVRQAQANTQHYTPQYGYFETRVKGPSTSANHASLWMIGYEDEPERSSEIALFELLGMDSSRVRYGLHPWDDLSIADEFFDETFDIDTTEFHIYGVEWWPAHLDFYLDNRKIRSINQSPGYPMQLMLSLYELPFPDAWTGAYDPATPYPKTFTVDYVRAYQPLAGYNV